MGFQEFPQEPIQPESNHIVEIGPGSVKQDLKMTARVLAFLFIVSALIVPCVFLAMVLKG